MSQPADNTQRSRGAASERSTPGTRVTPSSSRNPTSSTPRARVERRTQGLLVCARLDIPVGDVASGQRMDALSRPYPYNVRPVLVRGRLELWGTLPPIAEVLTSRRRWLVRQVETLAHELAKAPPRGAEAATDTLSPPPIAAASDGGAPPGTDVENALDVVSRVADGKRWQCVGDPSNTGFEIVPPCLDSGAGSLNVRPTPDGALLSAEIPLLATPDASQKLRAAWLVSLLVLNARCGFARLRVRGGDPEQPHRPISVRVEHGLPKKGLQEDEVDYALEGVRIASREAARVLPLLRHPAVAREYAAINEFAL